jgi:pimeloyl-ACP methyl ester carboxylesterase
MMQRIVRLLGIVALVISANAAALTTAAAAPEAALPLVTPGPCPTGTLSTGALSMYCVPTSGWNGDLVVFAHGYVAYNQPLGFYELTLPGGTYIPTLVQKLGYAFATTSYSENGLAILPGEDDIRALVAGFPSATGVTATHTYLVGVSEGGLVATLLTEQSPQLFSGTLAGCGPIGSFQKQIKYLGDFRVLFDYFFPSVLPPSPISIPQNVIDTWDTTYSPAITSAVSTNLPAAQQLIATSRAAVDSSNFASTVVSTTTGILWYNVFATNDATAKLGGNPYGNQNTVYHGSSNDTLLNQNVERFTADPTALANVVPYETSGNLTIPLVTLHTTLDPVVPFWHEKMYKAKAHPTGKGKLTQIQVNAYGHCAFTTTQLLHAFLVLVRQVTGHGLTGVDEALAAAQAPRVPLPSEHRTTRPFGG